MAEPMVSTNGKVAAAGSIVAVVGLVILVIFNLSDNMNTKLDSTTELLVQRIESLERHLSDVNTGSRERRTLSALDLTTHKASQGHPIALNQITSIEQKLLEVETQFRHTDRLIQLLWQRTYNEPLPNPIEAR